MRVTPMTLHDFSVDVAPAIQAGALVIGLGSLLLLWWQIRKANDWNRVSASFQVMELAEFVRLEERVIRQCKGLGVAFPNKLSRADATAVRNKFKSYHAMKAFVTFLERICIAYQTGYVDPDIISCSYGPLIVGFHSHLEEYFKVTREEMDAPDLYRDFALTAKEIEKQIQRQHSKRRWWESQVDRIFGTPKKL
jgi:hypothetical protein